MRKLSVFNTTMFDGARERTSLTLKRSRAFRDGNVVLWYEPKR